MKNIQLRKMNLIPLIKAVIKLERYNDKFFKNSGIMDFLDIDFGVNSFKIALKSGLPEKVISDLDTILKKYSSDNL